MLLARGAEGVTKRKLLNSLAESELTSEFFGDSVE